MFSISYHYSTYFSPVLSKSFHYSNLSSIFSNVFQLSETNINSYVISFMYKLPWYNCNILECSIKHHKLNPLFAKTYNYLSIYLHFYQNYRFYSISSSYFLILMSFKFPQSFLFYITA
jgi:hypothetical protein